MRAFVASFCIPALVAVAATAIGWAAEKSPRPHVMVNLAKPQLIPLRHTADEVILAHGDWVVFAQEEETQDLNGDGDKDDTVLQSYNATRNQTVNLGFASSSFSTDPPSEANVALAGDTLAVCVSERDQGGKDLNGDADVKDDVVYLVDLKTRKVTNTRIAGDYVAVNGGSVVIVTPEALQFGKDLNGDGDTRDAVVQVWDTAKQTLRNTQLDASGGFATAGEWLLAVTAEAAQGARDLNGDRDVADQVGQLYNLAGGSTFNTGLDCSFDYVLTPELLAVAIDEGRQGNRDLNGNSQVKDFVLHVLPLADRQVKNLGLDASSGLAADGATVAFVVMEARQGNQDLNRDGDLRDEVLHVYDQATGKSSNVGMDASEGIVVRQGSVAFVSLEFNQGRDLNGDMDLEDSVVVVYNVARNVLGHTRLATAGPLVMEANVLAFRVVESDQGDRSLNGDRDTDDDVLYVVDTAATPIRAVSPQQAANDLISISTRCVAFTTNEDDQGERDLNADGDAEDDVVQVYRF